MIKKFALDGFGPGAISQLKLLHKVAVVMKKNWEESAFYESST